MKNNNYICNVLYLRNSIVYGHDFWYSWVKWWNLLEMFFIFFLIFIFWADRRIKGGRRAKNNPKWQKFLSHSVYQGFLPKMKNNNYIPHVPYLRNSIAYNQDFWYSCVKWWYLQDFFFFYFFIFLFFGLLEG